MKKRTIYTLPKDTEITGEVIAKVIADHKKSIDVFTRLESYMDDEPIMDRTPPNPLLTINNFADYITSVNTGYLLGNPVDYKATDATDLDVVMENYNSQQIYDLDSDIANDCSMFGQAFENVYLDELSQATSAKLSVFNTQVVYDNTFKHNKLFAIYYSPEVDNNGNTRAGMYDVTIWTPTQILYRKLNGKNMTEADQPDAQHFAGTVPVLHYFNNKRMKGDYEPVITLIDAYNILQTDRVIDREKLVDAILAFHNTRMTEDDMKSLKENRVIGLNSDSRAEYITKQLDEQGADVLRQTIAADIHKFSKTPDLSDKAFGNAPSGVSILYKLLAFEQNIKNKERHFESALKQRFGLYVTLMKLQSKLGNIDPDKVDVVFRRALPKNDFETSQMINNLEGAVDIETLIGQLSFVDDASAVAEKAAKERETALAGNFGTDLEG